MHKKLFFTCLILIITSRLSHCFAQPSQPGALTIGLDGAVPVGSTSDSYNAGIGFSGEVNLKATRHLYGAISAGFEDFSTKSSAGLNSSYGFFPFKVGLKYYFVDGLFVEAQMGAVPGTYITSPQDASVPGSPTITTTAQTGSTVAFAYSTYLGYTMKHIEVSLRYEGWQTGATFRQAALRIAYRFSRPPKPKK